MRKSSQKILYLAQLALFASLIVALQTLSSLFPAIVTPTLSLVPIAVGAIMLGPVGGAILGATFGIVTIIMTFSNPVLTFLFQANPVLYVILALAKATLAGLGCGLIYKALTKCFRGRFVYLATVIASIALPIINTGVFVLGMLTVFSGAAVALPQEFPDIPQLASLSGSFQVVFIGLVGLNFFAEFLVNLILSPAIARIVQIADKKF